MDLLLKRYMPRIEFDSYEDFRDNYTMNVPSDFNFGYDVVDAWAQAEPEKRALVWCDESGDEKVFTFTDIRRLSNQAANFFQAQGVGKGSVVMLILRRRWEYWVCAPPTMFRFMLQEDEIGRASCRDRGLRDV